MLELCCSKFLNKQTTIFMNFRINKQRITELIRNLNESYQPTEEKPLVKIAELTLILPALGLFYIWEFFNHYGIHYFIYFDLKDALAVLYENLMPVIYISVIMSLTITLLIPDILRKGSRENVRDESSVDASTGRHRKGFSKLAIILIIIVILIGFYVLLQAYQFQNGLTFVFLAFAALSCYLYLFVHKNLGFGVGILLAFMYMITAAKKDAKYTATMKPRFNIVLKSHSDTPILTENDKCKFFIYKTSNYYFIKDNCKKLIYAYSISTGEMTSFTAK
jgi:hypothetical protein